MMDTLRAGRIIFFAIFFVMFSFATASAFCVYNHTNKTLEVYGRTATKVPGQFHVKIKPGDHKCCPGDNLTCGRRILVVAGSYLKNLKHVECLNKNISKGNQVNKYFFVFSTKKVPEHGSASIFPAKKEGDDWLRGHIKDKDGKIIWKGLLKAKCGLWYDF